MWLMEEIWESVLEVEGRISLFSFVFVERVLAWDCDRWHGMEWRVLYAAAAFEVRNLISEDSICSAARIDICMAA
jgi:hypothetical protein